MAEKDKEASELFRKFSHRLYSTALRITLSEDEAEEIMQETLIRYISGSGRIRTGSEAGIWSWLKSTCVHLSIDWLRRRKRFVNLDKAEDDGGSWELQEEEEKVWDMLDGKVFPTVMKLISEMPDGYRTILTLRLIEGYGYPETAALLGISESGVRSQYMRGRKMLADRVMAEIKKGRI